MRMLVGSLALLSGLRIQCCYELRCRSRMQLGSGVVIAISLVTAMVWVFVCFCLFRAVPVAYGSSQARSQTGAEAVGLCHSHSIAGSKPYL